MVIVKYSSCVIDKREKGFTLKFQNKWFSWVVDLKFPPCGPTFWLGFEAPDVNSKGHAWWPRQYPISAPKQAQKIKIEHHNMESWLRNFPCKTHRNWPKMDEFGYNQNNAHIWVYASYLTPTPVKCHFFIGTNVIWFVSLGSLLFVIDSFKCAVTIPNLCPKTYKMDKIWHISVHVFVSK